ncbi:uncharacterized protein [Drosophila kikkawai]|uniref:Fanconi anaemia group A protein N-terminal domain-containing protein n=1 Tax=Drosophila kikkawai TaxID=30033 RepID=A0A6P4IW67_DROKI|nr:uncharacterized protein LOC108078317 [Drosophila kikkawai]
MYALRDLNNCSNIGNSFGFVCRTLKKQCGIQQLGSLEKFEFVELLKLLNAKERLLASKFFCQLPANVGSFRVLLQLQQLGILTASEYILSKEHSEQLQVDLIIFLESEFELLTNVFISAAYDVECGVKLTSILTAALGNLYAGLVNNPKISNLGYVEPLRRDLPADALSVCRNMHLSTLMELHRSEDITEAFAKFSGWINEGVDELTFVKHLCDKLFACHHQEALQFLFKQSNMENFKEWKFYLILVQSIASAANSETSAFIRKHLKNRLLQTASSGCLKSLLHLLLTARAATATTMCILTNLDNYAKWYKQNIGEMTYILGTDKFQVMLGLLEESLQYERELQYLEIHVTIAISPGGRLVQAYKTKCRAYASQLKAEAKKKPLRESNTN